MRHPVNLRLLSLTLGAFAIGTEGFVIAGILPAIAGDLSVSVVAAGQLITIFAVGYALSSPVLATLTVNISPRRLLICAMSLFTVANVVAALAPSYGSLAGARAVAALAAALYTPTAAAVVASLAPAGRRGRALALLAAGVTVASVIGVPLGTWIGLTFGWRMTFWLVVVLAVLALAGIGAALPAVPRLAPISLTERVASLRNRSLLAGLAFTVVFITGVFTVYSYVAPLLQELTHVDGAQLSALLCLNGLAAVLGNWIGGYGADRWGARPTILTGLVVSVVNFLLLPFTATTLVGAGLALIVWGAAAWTMWAPQQHHLLELAPSTPGVALSFNASALYVGIALGSAVGGLVLDRSSVSTLGVAAGGIELLALGLLLATTQAVSTREPSHVHAVRRAGRSLRGVSRSMQTVSEF